MLSNEERERHEGLCVQPRDASHRECGDVGTRTNGCLTRAGAANSWCVQGNSYFVFFLPVKSYQFDLVRVHGSEVTRGCYSDFHRQQDGKNMSYWLERYKVVVVT